MGGASICYSGDGAPSDACRHLYQDADLLIHEAYYESPRRKNSHASVDSVLRLGAAASASQLHLVHLGRTASRNIDAILPETGDVFEMFC